MREERPIRRALGALRARAEAVVPGHPRADDADPARVHHELEVHRVELELQYEELLEAQHQLEESRDRYYELYDLAPIAYVTVDRAGWVVEANLRATQLLETPRAKLIGASLPGFLSEQGADVFHRMRLDVIETRGRGACDLTLQVGGKPVPVRLEAVASSSDAAGAPRVQCVLIDLSALRSAEDELRSHRALADHQLRESEARFQLIADHIEDVFYVRERDGHLSYVSPAFERIWGVPASHLYESRGTAWDRAVHTDDLDRVLLARRQHLKGDPFDETYRVARADGEVRWVRDRAFEVEDASGRMRRDVGVVHDITTERLLEEDLRQAQKMEVVGALASGVAHDFNNLLQAILGCLNVAMNERTPPARVRDHLRRASEAVRRGGDLAARLTTFGHKRVAAPHRIELDGVVADVAKLVARLVTERIQLVVRCQAPGGLVLADPVQIEQIILNLAANARDAMPHGGTLTLETRLVGRCALPDGAQERLVRMEVADTGEGIDEHIQPRIFDPFFTTKGPGKGTGLGLSTVRELCDRLGGQIDLRSARGQGTTIGVELPLLDVVAEPPSGRRAAAPVATLSGTVLLVEDQPLVRRTLREDLEHLGLDVLEASNEEEARTLLEVHRGSIDVLLTDVVMPGMQGPRLAEVLSQRQPGLRVLFISGDATELSSLEDTGPVGLLQKPFDQRELAERLGELLATTRPRRTEPPQALVRERPAPGATLMLVEDDAEIREALCDLLESEGYRVIGVDGPKAALERIAQTDAPAIDLLLTDVLMPGMSGVELAEELGRRLPALRVIFMSGQPRAPELGVFVQKPFALETLLRAIRETLPPRG